MKFPCPRPCSSPRTTQDRRSTYLHVDLVQLHESNRSSQALPFAVAEDQIQGTLHLLEFIRRRIQPSLWAELARVLTPKVLTAENTPSAVTNTRAAGNDHALPNVALGWRLLRHEASNWGEDAETFLDDCLKIRQIAGDGFGNDFTGVLRGCGFCPESVVGPRICYNMQHGGTNNCCCGVGSSNAVNKWSEYSVSANVSLHLWAGRLRYPETYICKRISDPASFCVSPWATNDPSMSFWTFLSGPNLSAATSLAILFMG